MKLVEHDTYKGMYYVQWPDGVLSKDFYNKTRAKEQIKLIIEQEQRKQPTIHSRTPPGSPRKLTGAFK